MTGIGNVHLKITAAPEAQTWFDQGLNLNYDFWDYESARAFQQAIRIDPNCAMCYWGLYLALSMRSSEDPYSVEALKKAVALKNHATKNERLYIEAAYAGEDTARDPNKRSNDDEESNEIKILRKSLSALRATLMHGCFSVGRCWTATTMTAKRKKERPKVSRSCKLF